MTRSFKFTRLLATALRDPAVEPGRRTYHRLTGRLDIGAVIVPVEIKIPWRFKYLKRYPPTVFCHAPWMRVGMDWHNLPPMCWTIPELWREAMNWRGKPVRAIMEQGREWFLNDVRCLINRHYTAHCEGLTSWPKEWAYWGHGSEGVREYYAEKRLLGITKPPRLRKWRAS